MMEENGKPVPLKQELEPHKQAITYAAAGGFGVVALVYIQNEIRLLLTDQFNFLRFLYVLLFLVVMLLGLSWVQSGNHELDLTAYWLSGSHYKPPQDVTIIGLIVGTGCVIGVLAVCSKWVTAFGFVYIFYLAVDLVWWRVRRVNYREGIASARKHVQAPGGRFTGRETTALAGIREMEVFYLECRHYTRGLLAVGVAVVAVVVSLSGSIIGETAARTAAYLLFIVQILVGETVIQYWRVVRDRKLRRLKEELEYGSQ